MTLAALDLWNLFVNYIFGGFWITVFALMLVFFLIMGVLGRMSIYSVMWYCIMFLLAMGLGFGFVPLNIIITIGVLVALYFSAKGYIDSK